MLWVVGWCVVIHELLGSGCWLIWLAVDCKLLGVVGCSLLVGLPFFLQVLMVLLVVAIA